MSLRPVKDVRESVSTMEGAGVALRLVNFAVAIVGLVALEVFSRTLSRGLMTLDLSPAVRSAVAAQRSTLGDVVVPASATAAAATRADSARRAAPTGAPAGTLCHPH